MKTRIWYLRLFLFIFAINYSFAQVPPTPTITVYGHTVSCNEVQLVSSAPFGNFWSNGANTKSITVFNTGTFSVLQVVGGFTSAPSAPVSVTVCPVIQPTIVPMGPFCVNSPSV